MIKNIFIYNTSTKKKILLCAVIGLSILIIGIIIFPTESSIASDVICWRKYYWTALWINHVYFVGIALIGVFFVALQYATKSGWSAVLKRIPETFGHWLPIAGIMMLLTFLFAQHDLFHWTHPYLMDNKSIHYDPVIAGKKAYLNKPFFLIRMIVYFILWIVLFYKIRKYSLQEDLKVGLSDYHKMVKYSVIFIIILAITSSTAAWDWVLSIDVHWFSTLIGWYTLVSWFVAGLSAITLLIVWLQDCGYLKMINHHHLHDLGKLIFAFSIFWAYLWVSQFLLIYYAHIPEETIYFVERLQHTPYRFLFFVNIILNFLFPLLALMTRDAKRYTIFLKIICTILLVGHWLDFYLMITPGILAQKGNITCITLGVTMIYTALFIHVILKKLTKTSLIAKQHPLWKESIEHHT